MTKDELRAEAIIEIRETLKDLEAQGAPLDHWQRVCMIVAIKHMWAGRYEAVAVELSDALLSPSARSDFGLPERAFEDYDVSRFRKLLSDLEDSPTKANARF